MVQYGTTSMRAFLWDVPWLSPHILGKDPYIEPNVVELPPEVAKTITFEEQSPTETLTDCKRW
jgi:hypothetical protein